MLRTTTEAPGTTAPEESWTTPVNVAVVFSPERAPPRPASSRDTRPRVTGADRYSSIPPGENIAWTRGVFQPYTESRWAECGGRSASVTTNVTKSGSNLPASVTREVDMRSAAHVVFAVVLVTLSDNHRSRGRRGRHRRGRRSRRIRRPRGVGRAGQRRGRRGHPGERRRRRGSRSRASRQARMKSA